MQQRYTGKQTLLIDLANQYPGVDKQLFDTRLAFGRTKLSAIQACKTLEALTSLCAQEHPLMDEPALGSMTMLAIWDTLQGRPSGHCVEIDAVNSGKMLPL